MPVATTAAALVAAATRVQLFTGKGGMGKTTLACATAVAHAAAGRRTLIVSTDPASNLDEVLGTDLAETPRPVAGVDGLYAANIDPEAAAATYREGLVGPYRGVLPDSAVAQMEESLSGACTVEIAAFDAFADLLGAPEATVEYDQVVFDTAPTGHTLRLLALPGAWTTFIDTSTTGTSCLGPLAGLSEQRDRYAEVVRALGDPATTTLVLVARPEPAALEEADRTRAELHDAGMTHQLLAVNGLHRADGGDDPTAEAMADGHRAAIEAMPSALATLPRVVVPLRGFAPIGPGALGRVLLDGAAAEGGTERSDGDAASAPERSGDDAAPFEPALEDVAPVAAESLAALVDELEAAGNGVVMTMGKGGVGKTTIAAAIAAELAARGHRTRLTTTDPAAHVRRTVDEHVDANLEVSRIDPAAETAAHTARVLSEAGAGLDADGLALLEEDLRSPCTEEIAVFSAFARTVAQGQDGFVVLDTAPTGHTLLLLDAAESYHREIARSGGAVDEAVAALLPRLRDPDHTRVVLVTLPEATPVHEAARLAADLGRAGIRPWGVVVNQSLAAAGSADPVLRARADRERRYLAEARELADRFCVVPWKTREPVGERLRALTAA